jgi:multicomponent Na+:H+ antiporter subunit G
MLADTLAMFLMVGGGFFCFVAGLGLVRMPDVYVRMHAATKAGTLGVGLLAAAVTVVVPETDTVVKAVLVAVFMITTTPIGSHLIGRAAFRTGAPLAPGTGIDPEAMRFMSPGQGEAAEERAGGPETEQPPRA